MNITNNKRHQKTISAIENAFMSLLREKEVKEISVTELCEAAKIDRSTFYANYEGILSLVNEVSANIEKQLKEQPHTDGEFTWIFEYIQTNKDVFEIYFKLSISREKTDYKMIFFRNGAYSVAKMWFDGGCVESPEKMGGILKREYTKLITDGKE